MKSITFKLALLFSLATILSCRPYQTNRIPDFQTRDVSLVENNLIANVQNNGAAVYEGDLKLRVIIAASLSAGYTVDKIVTVSESWNPGEIKSITLVSNLIPQNWPDAIDFPQKTVGVFADVGNQVNELNENNNLFETQFNVPCGVVITKVAPSIFTFEGYGHEFSLNLQGQFGSLQGTKNIVLQTQDGRTGLRFQDIQWDPGNISVSGTNMHFLPGGCYDLFVECASLDPNLSYFTSNTKSVCVEGTTNPDDDTQAQCPEPIQVEGWRYAGTPADCWSAYLIRSAGSVCDENGWYCCMQNADAQGSERCNTGYQEMTPPCCAFAEMSCDKVLRQPYGCYKRED